MGEIFGSFLLNYEIHLSSIGYYNYESWLEIYRMDLLVDSRKLGYMNTD